jgi:pheromone shutdown-related protein TraB
VSRESAELVRRVIEEERPDHVCVELDEQRFKALSQKNRWDSLNLKQVIRNKQLPTLLINLLLSSFQKRIGRKLGVLPGTELLEATRAADDLGIPYSLCDRNIRVTMLRAWRSMSLWKKNQLLAAIIAGAAGSEELSEEELARMRQHDVLSEMMNELAEAMPNLKRILIDERDTYLAEKILQAEGRRVVAVVGAGHIEGIKKALHDGERTELAPIEVIPDAVPVGRIIGWSIPVLVLGSLALIAWTKGSAVAGENLLFWILANGIPAGIGAVLALAHPLTVLAAVVAAPITSLTPVIGAGYVTAFVQAYVQPPLVRDFHTVSDEIASLRCWWSNRLLRLFLAFLLPTLGSLIGTGVGGSRILSSLFGE